MTKDRKGNILSFQVSNRKDGDYPRASKISGACPTE